MSSLHEMLTEVAVRLLNWGLVPLGKGAPPGVKSRCSGDTRHGLETGRDHLAAVIKLFSVSDFPWERNTPSLRAIETQPMHRSC